GFAVMSGGPEAHLESGDDVAQSSGLITGSAKAVAEAFQSCRKPLQGRGELAQQRLVVTYPGGIRPDGDAGLSQCLPGKERPGLKLALGGEGPVTDDSFGLLPVSLQYVLQQGDHGIYLLRVPGIPVAAIRAVPVARMHNLDADGAGVEPGAPLPAAVTGVPG